MGSKWIKYRLGDIATFSYGKMPKKELIGLGKYVVFSGYKYTDNYPEKNLSVGDLIVVARGVGGTGDVKIANQDCYLTNLSIKIDLDDKIIRKEYFYYQFKQNTLRYLDSGSAQSQITINDLSNIEIVAPLPEVQDSIIEKLRNLDKKIVINTSINQTLEQMSQTLFKSWFVDFDPVIDNALDAGNPIPEALQSRAELRQKVRNSADFKPLPADIRALFPAEFKEMELGWVPKGWITTSFNDLIELIGGGTPKTSVEEYWNGDIPWFSVVDAPDESDVYVLTTEKNITTEGLNNSSAKLLKKGTTIISARGTVGKCAMVAVPMAMNQSCYGVIGKNNISDEYVYFQLKNAVQTLQQMGHGSVFNTITRDTFKNIKVPFCNEELTNIYSLLVKNYFSKILNNNYQKIALTNLRDTLLPKLISGELSLEDLPNLVNQTEPA
ncbi:restriction endonuclease subunit S [uncultured Pluralibacter sp.]|uniref:restriction endonuclease subunit S n=1 Tax=uncultured Pluralibacter sp. TaxID=1490864 RepID=UPI00260BD1CA|nr:restriction endonuclease subunit S [uncultured Pluralibacter sp.]